MMRRPHNIQVRLVSSLLDRLLPAPKRCQRRLGGGDISSANDSGNECLLDGHPLLNLLLDERNDHAPAVVGDVLKASILQVHFALMRVLGHLLLSGRQEWRGLGEHEVQHDPSAEGITLEGRGLAFEHFWRSVAHRARRSPHLFLVGDQRGDAEIREHQVFAAVGHEEVLRLHISVKDLPHMQMRQRLQQVSQKWHGFFLHHSVLPRDAVVEVAV
mmetsp:Transcript_46837/g.111306  ORF Transcript_46837/g.111306 Transcript_46837/m.111306 type:complete len:215 (-) Transcript_46837:1184-1828(-)